MFSLFFIACGGADFGAGPSSGKGETATRLRPPLLQQAPMADVRPVNFRS